MPTSSRSRPGMICRWPCTKTSGVPPLLVSSTWPPSSLSVYSRLTVVPFCTALGLGAGVWANTVDAASATRAAASFTMRVIVTTSFGHGERSTARDFDSTPGLPGEATRRGNPRSCYDRRNLESLLRLVSAGRRTGIPRRARAARRRERDARRLPPTPAEHPGRAALALLPGRHVPLRDQAGRDGPLRSPGAGFPGRARGEDHHGAALRGSALAAPAGRARPAPHRPAAAPRDIPRARLHDGALQPRGLGAGRISYPTGLPRRCSATVASRVTCSAMALSVSAASIRSARKNSSSARAA